ncbi:MAG: hypothetical protein JWQ58_918, partial [Reyranella sp.]|nr:hypothetical protein [Reyranella sp.]
MKRPKETARKHRSLQRQTARADRSR